MSLLSRFSSSFYNALCNSQVILVDSETTSVAVRALVSQIDESMRRRKDRLMTQHGRSSEQRAQFAIDTLPPANVKELQIVNCNALAHVPTFQKVLRQTLTPYVVIHWPHSNFSQFVSALDSNGWTHCNRIWYELMMAHQAGISARRYIVNQPAGLSTHYVLAASDLTCTSLKPHAVA